MQSKNTYEDAPREWFSLLNLGSKRKVPVVLQTETTECGLACIAMLANYHGRPETLLTLRSKYPTSLRGNTFQDLMAVATSLGMSARPVKLDIEQLDELHVPCILHWNLNHFVVLTSVGKEYVDIIDPSSGQKRLSLDRVKECFTGVALEVFPGSDFQRGGEADRISLGGVFGSLKGLAKGLGHVLIMALFLELIGLLVPQFMQLVVDQVLADGDGDLLYLLGVVFSALLVIRLIVEGMRSWTLVWISTSLNMSWTSNVMRHLVGLPVDYFQKRYLGDVISRMGSVNAIQQTLTTGAVSAFTDGLMTSITLLMLFYYHRFMALLVLAIAAAYALLRAIYFRLLRDVNRNQINVIGMQQGVLIETLRGIQTIKLNNGMPWRLSRYMNATADVLNVGIRLQRLTIVFDTAKNLLVGGSRIAILWIGANQALDGEMTTGMLMAFLAYSDQFLLRSWALIDYFVQFRLLRLHAERLADIVLTQPEQNAEAIGSGEPVEDSLVLRDVTFRYDYSSPPVLSQCNLSVGAGEIVAITGASGSGKSTLAKVLLGIVDPSAGRMFIGGVDAKTLGKKKVRAMVSSVMQDDHVFSGTLMDNISFFDPAADLEKVRAAAIQANLDLDIQKMPMGYLTLIGDMGSSLSGGQRQRLLLARAFYKAPRILVLDEATSYLDLESERRICDAVRKVGVTTIILAHRPQTIQSADRVLKLIGGKIVDVPEEQLREHYGITLRSSASEQYSPEVITPLIL